MSTKKQTDIKVFICYAREDSDIAKRLYADLERAGVSPWIDTEDLKPGEKWKILIPKMMEKSSYVLILLSPCSISKRGFVQHEIKEALKLSEAFPSSAIFIIPVRLEDCESPIELEDLQWVDLFPEYDTGFAKLLKVLAPEGRDELLFRKIQRLAEEYKRLQQEKGLETESDALLRLESEMTEVQTQRQRAEEQLHDLHKPSPKQEQPREVTIRRKAEGGEIISLRSEPMAVSDEDAPKVFRISGVPGRPLEYIENQFEDQGEVVVDHVTDLMWQKTGSPEGLIYVDAQKYVEELNQKKFAGYNDWRLPTIPELMSLLEPEKQSNALLINPIFDVEQWYWSADRCVKDRSSSRSAWHVYFLSGYVHGHYLHEDIYVRCVRSLHQESPHVRQEPERETTPKLPSQKSPETSIIQLRSERVTVSVEEVKEAFGLDEEWRLLEYFQNDYEDQGKVVIDHATGLMWQKSGSDGFLTFKDAQTYIDHLNQKKFAGYSGWRLPTILELMSLLEPEGQSNELYINPIFDATQLWCWSADRRSSGPAWFVYFYGGIVYWGGLGYVRGVRFRQQEASHTRQEPKRETKLKSPPQKVLEPPAIHLRSGPLPISEEEFREVFGLDEEWRPLEYIQNDNENQDEVVVDHTTGLMWQKMGSGEWLKYKDAQKYVEELNRQQFAGYDDWRLPTIPELMSLLEPEEKNTGLYIDPVFDVTQRWCWSADRLPAGEISSGAAWNVDFSDGDVCWDYLHRKGHVLVVRS